jgi:hypothetical protein
VYSTSHDVDISYNSYALQLIFKSLAARSTTLAGHSLSPLHKATTGV